MRADVTARTFAPEGEEKDYAGSLESMAVVADHFQGRKVVDGGFMVWAETDRILGHGTWHGVLLNDGSAVVALSQWEGPYSPETPDIDAQEPLYAILWPKEE